MKALGRIRATLEALRHKLVVVRGLAREEDRTRLVWLRPLQPRSAARSLADRTAEAAPSRRAARFQPLIGRQAEEALLRKRWWRVRQGEGQAVVVVVRGEAGIGKSHLGHGLRAHATNSDARWPAARWIETRCSPTSQHSAFSDSA